MFFRKCTSSELCVSCSIGFRKKIYILFFSLLTSYIAYATNRTFVFDDYVWSHLPIPYTLYDFSLRPTRIPLNAFISGPTAGSNVPTSMNRAISADYFDYICPPSARVSIKYSSPFVGNEGNGLDIVNGWRERLNKDDVRNTSCLEIRETESRIFDVKSVHFILKPVSTPNIYFFLVSSAPRVFCHFSLISETLPYLKILLGRLSLTPLLIILP